MTENLSLFHVLSSAYFNKTVKKDGAYKTVNPSCLFSVSRKKDFSINYGTDFVISIGQRRVINVESGICCLRRRVENINFPTEANNSTDIIYDDFRRTTSEKALRIRAKGSAKDEEAINSIKNKANWVASTKMIFNYKFNLNFVVRDAVSTSSHQAIVPL